MRKEQVLRNVNLTKSEHKEAAGQVVVKTAKTVTSCLKQNYVQQGSIGVSPQQLDVKVCRLWREKRAHISLAYWEKKACHLGPCMLTPKNGRCY